MKKILTSFIAVLLSVSMTADSAIALASGMQDPSQKWGTGTMVPSTLFSEEALCQRDIQTGTYTPPLLETQLQQEAAALDEGIRFNRRAVLHGAAGVVAGIGLGVLAAVAQTQSQEAPVADGLVLIKNRKFIDSQHRKVDNWAMGDYHSGDIAGTGVIAAAFLAAERILLRRPFARELMPAPAEAADIDRLFKASAEQPALSGQGWSFVRTGLRTGELTRSPRKGQRTTTPVQSDALVPLSRSLRVKEGILNKLHSVAWGAAMYWSLRTLTPFLVQSGSWKVFIAPDVFIAMAFIFTIYHFIVQRRSRGGLIDAGIYRVTRNPIYLAQQLANACIIALSFEYGLWHLALPLGLVFLINRRMIAWEEIRLTLNYGKPYQDYLARVPRWLGLSSFKRDNLVLTSLPTRKNAFLANLTGFIGLATLLGVYGFQHWLAPSLIGGGVWLILTAVLVPMGSAHSFNVWLATNFGSFFWEIWPLVKLLRYEFRAFNMERSMEQQAQELQNFVRGHYTPEELERMEWDVMLQKSYQKRLTAVKILLAGLNISLLVVAVAIILIHKPDFVVIAPGEGILGDEFHNYAQSVLNWLGLPFLWLVGSHAFVNWILSRLPEQWRLHIPVLTRRSPGRPGGAQLPPLPPSLMRTLVRVFQADAAAMEKALNAWGYPTTIIWQQTNLNSVTYSQGLIDYAWELRLNRGSRKVPDPNPKVLAAVEKEVRAFVATIQAELRTTTVPLDTRAERLRGAVRSLHHLGLDPEFIPWTVAQRVVLRRVMQPGEWNLRNLSEGLVSVGQTDRDLDVLIERLESAVHSLASATSVPEPLDWPLALLPIRQTPFKAMEKSGWRRVRDIPGNAVPREIAEARQSLARERDRAMARRRLVEGIRSFKAVGLLPSDQRIPPSELEALSDERLMRFAGLLVGYPLNISERFADSPVLRNRVGIRELPVMTNLSATGQTLIEIAGEFRTYLNLSNLGVDSETGYLVILRTHDDSSVVRMKDLTRTRLRLLLQHTVVWGMALFSTLTLSSPPVIIRPARASLVAA